MPSLGHSIGMLRPFIEGRRQVGLQHHLLAQLLGRLSRSKTVDDVLGLAEVNVVQRVPDLVLHLLRIKTVLFDKVCTNRNSNLELKIYIHSVCS